MGSFRRRSSDLRHPRSILGKWNIRRTQLAGPSETLRGAARAAPLIKSKLV
jgi:hypothetical protein